MSEPASSIWIGTCAISIAAASSATKFGSFVGMKEKQARLKADRPENVGDVWT
jgi:hypothetical protein